MGDYKAYLANQKYCIDISQHENKLFAYDRIVTDNIPSFVCLGEKISSKIALLTADEMLYADKLSKKRRNCSAENI